MSGAEAACTLDLLKSNPLSIYVTRGFIFLEIPAMNLLVHKFFLPWNAGTGAVTFGSQPAE